MIRTVEEFQKAAIEHGIDRWVIRRCSMCNYPLAYLLGEGVLFDSGCDCTYGRGGAIPSSWEDVADHYNRNQRENNPDIKQETLDAFDAFWHFDSVPA